MLTPDEQQQREGKIGSSDAPVIAGVSPYQDPLTLYYKLRGDLPRYDAEETFEQQLGVRLEPVIAEIVAESLDLKIRRAPVKVHPEHPFMVAHLDYEIVSHPRGPGVLEIKRRTGQPFDELPEDITLQVAHQLAVTNRQWAKVAVMFGYGRPKLFDVERDKELEHYLIELEAKFLLRVERGEPPTTTKWAETSDLWKRLYPQDSGKEIVLDDPKVLTAVTELVAVKTLYKQAEEDKTALESYLKSMIQDASVATIPNFGEVTWKATKPIKDFDEAAFKIAEPVLYEKYLTNKPGYRRLLLKPEKAIKP